MDLKPLEKLVLNAINHFQVEYNEGVPLSILKLDLNLSDSELQNVLSGLIEKSLIEFDQRSVKKLEEKADHKLMSAAKLSKIQEDLDLSDTENRTLNLLLKICGDKGEISRNLLEGHLLYGELALSTKKSYNVLLSLENKGLIRRVHHVDGDYYQINKQRIC